MNFTGVYYKEISKRLIKYMEENQYTLQRLSEEIKIDYFDLSRIKNTIIIEKKNKYFLSPGKIEILCSQMGISADELIWGGADERERFIKIILCAVLMNGAEKSPFVYFDEEKPLENRYELFQWAYTQRSAEHLWPFLSAAMAFIEAKPDCCMDDSLIFSYGQAPDAPIKECTFSDLYYEVQNFFKTEYPFFYNKENKTAYDNLISDNKTDPDLDELAFLILEQIMNDYAFTKSFITRLTNDMRNYNYIHHHPNSSFFSNIRKDDIKPVKNRVEQFISRKGKYGDLITDYVQYDFHLFVKAFEKFWEEYKDIYMDYFEKNLFNKSNIETNGLKKLTNSHIMQIINSDSLKEIIHDKNILAEYTQPPKIIIKNYIRNQLQFVCINISYLEGKIPDYLDSSFIVIGYCLEQCVNRAIIAEEEERKNR